MTNNKLEAAMGTEAGPGARRNYTGLFSHNDTGSENQLGLPRTSALPRAANAMTVAQMEKTAIESAVHSVHMQILAEKYADGAEGYTHGTRNGYVYHECRGPMCLHANSRGMRGAEAGGNSLSARIKRATDEEVKKAIKAHKQQREDRGV